MAKQRIMWLAIALAVVIAGGVVAAVLVRDSIAGTPVAQIPCDNRLGVVAVYFNTNDEMLRAQESLRGDDRVASLRTETKEQAYERFKEIFKDQPELVKLARVEAMPASVTIMPRDLPSTQLAEQLRREFPGADTVEGDICNPSRLPSAPPTPPTT